MYNVTMLNVKMLKQYKIKPKILFSRGHGRTTPGEGHVGAHNQHITAPFNKIIDLNANWGY